MHCPWAMLRLVAAAFAFVLYAPAQFLRGVNVAGAEFAENRIPGVINTDFTYNSEATFRYFASKNMTLLRIPVRWERMQPVLFGPLDQANLDALRRNVVWSAQYGLKVVIDIHNYGRYKLRENGAVNEYVIDALYGGAVRVPASALADLWRRISAEFQAEPAVYAYDLMNEPHDMGAADWKAISQAALSAIRANGDQKLVMVPGNSWSSAERWPQTHGPDGWIADPANNFAYEAHQYFDADASGTYAKTFDQELASNADLLNVGRARLAPFAAWCRANRARCFLGEYGAPGNDPRWLTVLDNFLSALDDVGMDGVYWAGGEWWGDYTLSAQPQGNFTIDRPQMAVLQAHAGRNPLTAVPAASYADAPLAPGSLAAAFGKNLGGTGVRLELTDSAGRTVAAPLLAATAAQVNFFVPEDTALGRATLVLRSDAGILAGGTAEIVRISPALF